MLKDSVNLRNEICRTKRRWKQKWYSNHSVKVKGGDSLIDLLIKEADFLLIKLYRGIFTFFLRKFVIVDIYRKEKGLKRWDRRSRELTKFVFSINFLAGF